MSKIHLTGWLVLMTAFSSFGQPSAPTARICDEQVFEQLMSGLQPGNLHKLYPSQFNLLCLLPPTAMFVTNSRDSILVVQSIDDKLKLLENQNPYVAILLEARLRSTKVDFGQGIHVGCTKKQFCAALRQSEEYQVYLVFDVPDGDHKYRYLSFDFQGGLLNSVYYVNKPKLERVKDYGCQ